MNSYFLRYSLISLHKMTALTLVGIVFLAATPSMIVAAELKDLGQSIADVTRSSRWLKSIAVSNQQRPAQTGLNDGGAMPQRRAVAGVRPQPPRTRLEREGGVASLEMNPTGNVQLKARQPMLFSAVPVDSAGAAIHGLHAEWESSDKNVVVVRKSGMATGHRAGTAVLTAKVGSARQSVNVTVVPESQEEFGGEKQQALIPTNQEDSLNRTRMTASGGAIGKARTRQAHGANESSYRAGRSGAPLPMPLNSPNFDPLPDGETSLLYQAANTVGKPSIPTIEPVIPPNGNSNFTVAFPVVALPGRGLNASLSLI
jgi:hypothetical protein